MVDRGSACGGTGNAARSTAWGPARVGIADPKDMGYRDETTVRNHGAYTPHHGANGLLVMAFAGSALCFSLVSCLSIHMRTVALWGDVLGMSTRKLSHVVQEERVPMAERTHVVKYVGKVRGRDLQGEMRVLDKTQPHQLMLFQTFLPEDLRCTPMSRQFETKMKIVCSKYARKYTVAGVWSPNACCGRCLLDTCKNCPHSWTASRGVP